MATVVLVGTLDTKGGVYAYLRERVREAGPDVVLVDTGVLGEPRVEPDVTHDEMARAAGADLAELARAGKQTTPFGEARPMISVEGAPFHVPDADAALFGAIREQVDPARVEVHELDLDINYPAFAVALAGRLHDLHLEWKRA